MQRQRLRGCRQLSQLRSINMNEPHTWFRARELTPRKVVCHIGPTNSGKTYTAIKSLEEAKSGIYCGPLRLLAWEIYEKLRQGSRVCALLTGQEAVLPQGHTHVSCTVEMTDLKGKYDVAVIDEAQLLGDVGRGWAWTNAFLGLMASEIHVCGSKSMLPVITRLCEKTGDKLTVHEYKRLSPLTVSPLALSSLSQVFHKLKP